MKENKGPFLTVDIIIEYNSGIVLIKRKYAPHGWALPGGFVEYGESLEDAAIREAKEETNLDVELVTLLYTYSDPSRDPRRHTVSAVFIAKGDGKLKAGDDAGGAKVFTKDEIPSALAFDHKNIVNDYLKFKETGKRPKPGGRK